LAVDRTIFAWTVRAGFQHRRKMLRQALSRAPGSPMSRTEWSEFLRALGISDSARAEELTLDEWTRLARAISHQKRGQGHDI
jgi:16S rRNA A1518/A1519 N6-dimethyltransferase RsmA/KsgA/DIM1 with predicted DNA glycosylase/AP lyase activity